MRLQRCARMVLLGEWAVRRGRPGPNLRSVSFCPDRRYIHGCKMRRNILVGAAGLIVLSVACFGAYIYLIRKFHRDMECAATPEEKRAAAHRVLAWTSESHNAFLELCSHGNEESVPYLMAALRHMPDYGPEGPICTWGCCIEALEKITGQKHGTDKNAWLKWYAERSRQPQRPAESSSDDDASEGRQETRGRGSQW